MKQIYTSLFLLIACCISTVAIGQQKPITPQNSCGTVMPATPLINKSNKIEYQRIENDFLSNFGSKSMITDTVPMQLHVIRTSAGTGGITTSDLNTAIANMNTYYANASIYLEQCAAINYIDSDTYYNFLTSDEAAMTGTHNVSNVINIYFANSVGNGTLAYCGYAYFPGGPDVILMNNSCAVNGSTLIHEVGHYFGLYHTHETSTGTELVNGSNCANSGDLLCDTPADPKLSSSVVNTSCVYTGTATDPNGAAYSPMVNNIMSYSRKVCRDTLTPQQYARISSTNTMSRSYLTCGNSGGGGNTAYCLPTFNNTCTSGDYIDSVAINTIDNGNTGCANPSASNYSDYTSLNTTLDLDSTYTIYLKAAPQYGQYFVAFIDFNKDNDFDDAGEFFDIGYAGAGATISGNISIPSSAVTDTTRLRVLCRYSASSSSSPLTQADACATGLSYGEVEDYNVVLNQNLVGDNCGNAITISSLPYTTNGNTSGFTDDYLEICSFSTSGAPDMVYLYTPSSNETIDITLCGGVTDYDTRLYVYENTCPATGSGATGSPFACNDDDCDNSPIYTNAYISRLTNLALTGGNSYYIVVDGYSTESGNYTLDIQSLSPPPVNGTCTNTVTSYPYVESFENAFSDWTQGTGDDTDWIQYSGNTISLNTGPSSAFDSTYYIYIEASAPNFPSKQAHITSPCIDLSNLPSPYLKFAYHMFGGSMGTLDLSISTDTGATWTSIWNKSGDQGNQWLEDSINLSAYNGTVQFSFTGTTGSSFHSDIAIDKFQVHNSNGAIPLLSVNPSSLTPSAASGSDAISVTSNTNWSVTENSSWLSVSSTTGSNNSSFDISYTTNSSSSSRTATVTVSATGINQTITITQAGVLCTLGASSTSTNVSCNGGNNGAISLSLSNATGTPSYAWSNNATTQNITGLAAGSYTCTITDPNGCTHTEGPIVITEPTALSESATQVDVSCNGTNTGSINLTASGGTGNLTYAWSNNATTQNISGLAAGSYTCTITDANNCTLTSATYTITEPTALSESATQVDVSCNGTNTGSINLTASGGTGNLTYAWSNNATTQNISGLAAGSYTCTITDANNCTLTSATYTITEPTALSESATQANVLCNGTNTGSINLTASGGTGNLTYAWSNNATTQNISGLAPGSYTCTITDANNCTLTSATYTITEPTALSESATQANVLCNGTNTGSINLTASGGTGNLTYAWSNNATTQNISGLAAGSYTCTITDANNCTLTSATYTITEPAALVVNLDNIIQVNTGGDGGVDITVTGGTTPYTYLWSDNSTNEDLSNISEGTYAVTVTDANNCSFVLDNIYINTVGLNDIKEQLDIVIMPNPARDFLYVSFKDIPTGEWEFLITNTLGQVVNQNTIWINNPQKTITLNTANLVNGMYQISISNKEENILSTKQIIIAK